MRTTLRFSADEQPSTLDQMLSSLPRPSLSAAQSARPLPTASVDAAPTPTIPSGPRPIHSKPGLFRRLLDSSSNILRRFLADRSSRPSSSGSASVQIPVPANRTAVTAAWLGGPGPERERARSEYMDRHNFANLDILQALRELCTGLYLNAESQQLDRILASFAEKWTRSNPTNGYKCADVVNLISYSLVILNGDLHRKEVENKMTRAQYVRNTLPPLGDVAIEKDAGAFSGPEMADDAPSTGPVDGKRRAWERQIEGILRGFYASIRERALPTLPREELPRQQSAQTLPLPLKRSPSMISKAVSENQTAGRGRGAEARLSTHRWQSRPRPPPINTKATSTRSSFDAPSSPPSPSSIWSKVSNVAKTQTTTSIYSLASSTPRPEYQQAIGFANALSTAIIKEEGIDPEENDTTTRLSPTLHCDDESLELEGAPWAKEGLIKHKHVLGSHGARARSRQWSGDIFAVIERGHLRLFSFTKHSTPRWKRRSWEATQGIAPGAVVGGGNWMDNAELLHTFELQHTVATHFGTKSYSPTRPHVWALNMPDGALHLFSTGTAEIAREFTDTANYWAARTSKRPFHAGYTNANYGFEPTTFDPAAPLSLWHPPAPSMGISKLVEIDQLEHLQRYAAEVRENLAQHAKLKEQVCNRRYPGGDPRAVTALGNWDAKARYLSTEKAKMEAFISILAAAEKKKGRVYREREGRGEVR